MTNKGDTDENGQRHKPQVKTVGNFCETSIFIIVINGDMKGVNSKRVRRGIS